MVAQTTRVYRRPQCDRVGGGWGCGGVVLTLMSTGAGCALDARCGGELGMGWGGVNVHVSMTSTTIPAQIFSEPVHAL